MTTPGQLAAQGGSNGGLLMGVMVTSYPELFGAMVCQVPLLDMRRYHLLLAGASWMAEYGDPDEPAEWEYISAILAVSARRRDRRPIRRCWSRPRPATIASIPVTPARSPRDSRSRAHRLVLREIEGGHGGAADNKQAAFKSALAYEFLWQTVGSADA